MSGCDTSSNKTFNSGNQTLSSEERNYNEICYSNRNSDLSISFSLSLDSDATFASMAEETTSSSSVSDINYDNQNGLFLTNKNSRDLTEITLDTISPPSQSMSTLASVSIDLLQHDNTIDKIVLFPTDAEPLSKSKPTQPQPTVINTYALNAISQPIATTSVIMTKASKEITNNCCKENTIKPMTTGLANTVVTTSLASTSMTKTSNNDERFNSLFIDNQSNSTFVGNNCNDSSLMVTSRRVSFPKSDHELVTGYLEPANPWKYVCLVKSTAEISELYIASCNKHRSVPISTVIEHLKTLELNKSIRHPCLSLKNNKLAPEDCEALEEIFKRIQYDLIDISSCQLNETSAGALFDMIEYYEAAKELNVSDNPNISTRGWDACVLMIKRSRALHSLMAQGNPLSQSNAKNLGASLNSSCLHTIKLEHCGLRGSPISYLCSALKRNSTLKELWLAHNDISNVDADNIADLLRVNAHLQFLDISNNDIKDIGMKHIAKALIYQSTVLLPSINPNPIVAAADCNELDTFDSSNNGSLLILNSTSGNQIGFDTEIENANVKTIKNISFGGRSMLDTLLTMRKEEKLNTDEKYLKQIYNPTALLPQHIPSKENDNFFKNSTNSLISENGKASLLQSQGEEKLFTCHQNEKYYEEKNSCILNNDHVDVCKSGSNCHPTTKALDVKKISKISDLDDTQSSDSAFESASEGDISKIIPEVFPRKSSFDNTRNEGTKENCIKTENQINHLASFEHVAEMQNFQTHSPNSTCFSDVTTAAAIPPYLTRNRTHSSDSLSSENSNEGSSTERLHFTNKINEKLTKNDTLTRQKQLDVPQETKKKPSGLKAIIVWNNNLTKMSGEYISDLLAFTVTLELLNIGKNILSNDFVTTIKDKLSKNTTVTNLGLQGTHLSCTGIKTLASVLQFGGNCTLQRIDIRDNNLHVESLQSVAEALKSNKSVTQIDIDDEPKRISIGNDALFQYSRVLHNIRSLCSYNNEKTAIDAIIKSNCLNSKHASNSYFNSRKISLTCQSMPSQSIESNNKLDVKKKTGSRLRSPIPSPPIMSPILSPVPSPSKSRFKVIRVIENINGSSTLSESPSPLSPGNKPLCSSRFRVVKINECTPKSVPNASPPFITTTCVPSTKIMLQNENINVDINNIEKLIQNKESKCDWNISTHLNSKKDSLDSSDDQTITKDNVNHTIQRHIILENDQNKQLCDDILAKPAIDTTIIETNIAKGNRRTRKNSWVSNSTYSATVDRLISIFHPNQIFNRSNQLDKELVNNTLADANHAHTIASNQSLIPIRKTSEPISLFQWSKLDTPITSSTESLQLEQQSNDNNLNQIETSTSFFDVASKQMRGIADFGRQAFRHNLSFDKETLALGHLTESAPESSNESISVIRNSDVYDGYDKQTSPFSHQLLKTIIVKDIQESPEAVLQNDNEYLSSQQNQENVLSIQELTAENTLNPLKTNINTKKDVLSYSFNDQLNKFEPDDSSLFCLTTVEGKE